MRKISLTLLAGALSALSVCANDPMQWFQDAKLGMFVHWGLYSQTAGEWKGHPTRGGEHFMLYERIPLKEYALIANDFNPTEFDAEKWVKTAKDAGIKYIVYTTKHHDGFAMYDSKCSDYNIVKRTPYAKDPLKELAEACRREGVKLGLYYSLGRDWEDPDVPTNWPEKAGRSNTWDFPDEDSKQLPRYIERKVKPQIKELLTNYGEIAFMWFDTPELVTETQSRELRDIIKTLQPECLINSRIGNGLGDYSIIEQKLSDKIIESPWEACITMGKNWGYNQFDTVYKAPDMLIRNLTDIVSKGGNLLLNVGPNQKGYFPEQTRPIFDAFNKWLSDNGEAIYGTRPWRVFGESVATDITEESAQTEFHDAVFDGTPKNIVPDVRYTRKNNTIYAIVRNVPSASYTLSAFSPKTDKVKSVTLLKNGNKADWRLTKDGLQINGMGSIAGNTPIYVLRVDLESDEQ
ncbi:MAG: alpha-L-fucosidase [Paramuribaculum sp.]|nr:alpha-L-fucosidase [Paramuribaculum sp.]